MTDARIPVAVLGASGYIGQHFVRLLADHPSFELVALGSGELSLGRRLEDVWQLTDAPPAAFASRRLERLGPAALRRRRVDVGFSALPSGSAGTVETGLVRRGISVFTNAADHRMDPFVPLLVPEVNAGHLRLVARHRRGQGLLVANPN